MGPAPTHCKRIVAAALVAVGFSLPGALPATAQPAAAPDDATAEDGARGGREADLLRQLAEAESPEAAALIETELSNLWSQSGSAAIDLLLKRGQDALAAGAPEVAVEHLSAAIDHDPAFAEAYAARASAYYLTGRVGPAIDDLREALVLNPRHLAALQGFAAILEELGREADALEILRRVADMDPQDAEAQAAADRLAAAIEGRAL